MNWKETTIEAVCEKTARWNPSESPNDTFRYVDISSVDHHAKVISDTKTFIGSKAPTRARERLQTNDILVSTVRPNLNTVAIVPEELDGEIASSGFCVLRPDTASIIPRYLFYRCLSEEFIAGLESQAKGTVFQAVSNAAIKEQSLSLPPIPEQRRIVELLDLADSLRKKRREAVSHMRSALSALFSQQFGDPVENPMEWPTMLGRDLFCDLQYGTSSKSHGDEEPGDIPILMPRNIRDGVLHEDNTKFTTLSSEEAEKLNLQRGDLLFVRTGPTPGHVANCAVVPEEISASFALHLIRGRIGRDKEVIPEFIQAQMSYPSYQFRIRAQADVSATGARISSEGISNLEFIVPPKEKQKQFIQQQSRILNLTRAGAESDENIEKIFRSLLHRAFSGDLTSKWRENNSASM